MAKLLPAPRRGFQDRHRIVIQPEEPTGGGGAPDPHAASHQNGGTDEVNVAGLSGLLADRQTPLAHATDHQNGGPDEVSVAGLSGQLADDQPPLAHKTKHEDGGTDEISVENLLGVLAQAQQINVRKNGGANVGLRPRLNLIEGTNVTLTVADDGVDNEVDVTINATGGGSYTDEEAQDAVAGMLMDSETIEGDYDDTTPLLSFNLTEEADNPQGMRGFTVYDDFLAGSIVIAAPGHNSKEGWVRTVLGTGATLAKIAGTPDHPGIIELATGTTSTGRACISLDVIGIRLSGGKLRYDCMINIPNIPTGTEDFRLDVGLGDVVAAGQSVDAVMLAIRRAVSTTDWLRTAIDNSARTEGVSGTAFANGWVKLSFVVNAAGTSVEYFINDVSVGTETVNIPIAAGRETGILIKIEKIAGVTNRTVQVDYVRCRQWLTTPR